VPGTDGGWDETGEVVGADHDEREVDAAADRGSDLWREVGGAGAGHGVDAEVDLVARLAELSGQQVTDALLDQRTTDPGGE
jgi:hypothetical protein